MINHFCAKLNIYGFPLINDARLSEVKHISGLNLEIKATEFFMYYTSIFLLEPGNQLVALC